MIDVAILQAIYGGTFDPIHYGHLKPVEILADLIGLQKIIIILNNNFLYRPKPIASSTHRKIMIKLAIADRPLFHLNEQEIYENSFLSTSQILQKWRMKCGPKKPLAFIIGQDSLLTFPSWYQYETILENSHLIVYRRPGYSLVMKEKHHQKWLEKNLTSNINDLHTYPAGNIYLAETPWFDISATVIRYRLQYGKSCKNLVPSSVLYYILQNNLY